MKVNARIKKLWSFFGPIVIIGILAYLTNIPMIIERHQIKNNPSYVVGRVYDKDHLSEARYAYYYRFEVNGQEYRGIVNSSSSYKNINDTILIRYLTGNPSRNMPASASYW